MTCAAFDEYLLITMAETISPDSAAPYMVEVKKHNLCVSDIILLKAEAHRNDCPFERVIETLPSTNGQV